MGIGRTSTRASAAPRHQQGWRAVISSVSLLGLAGLLVACAPASSPAVTSAPAAAAAATSAPEAETKPAPARPEVKGSVTLVMPVEPPMLASHDATATFSYPVVRN